MFKKSKNLLVLFLIAIILIGIIIPVNEAATNIMPNGYDKGLSYKSVIPTKKVTFVNYDDETLIDDYAYLAAVPTAVFNYDGSLVSHPLLLFQEKMRIEKDKYLPLDAYQGIEYFMEDWESYCTQMDQMTLINVDETKANNWKAKEYIEIVSENPFKIASSLALQDWEYSDEAVIAVIGEEFEELDNEVSNKFE